MASGREGASDGGAGKGAERDLTVLFRLAGACALCCVSPPCVPASVCRFPRAMPAPRFPSTPPPATVHSTRQVSPAVKAIAGSIGGVVEAMLLQPIDVMKTRLQLDHSGQYKGEWSLGRGSGFAA